MRNPVLYFGLTSLFLLFLYSPALAQEAGDIEAHKAIESAVLDYIEGIYEDDPARIERSVHSELSKLGIRPENGGPAHFLHIMDYDDTVELAATPDRPAGIPADAEPEIEILHMTDRVASVKIQAMWGPELVNVAKENGEWKVMQILWQERASGPSDTESHIDDPARQEVAALLDAYFEGLVEADASGVSFTEDVVLENPRTRREGEPMRGIDTVVEFFESAGANMPRVDVERHIIEGSNACTILEWETAGGASVPTVNCFEIKNGAISKIGINFDQSPFFE